MNDEVIPFIVHRSSFIVPTSSISLAVHFLFDHRRSGRPGAGAAAAEGFGLVAGAGVIFLENLLNRGIGFFADVAEDGDGSTAAAAGDFGAVDGRALAAAGEIDQQIAFFSSRASPSFE